LFLDVGNIWGVDFSGATDASKIRSSLGVGFSWRSPIGPLSFSYAEPLSKHKSDKTEKFNFKLGGIF
jgi:outer membrane protein insertion porin family